jgi:hypothetical protein
MQKAPAKPFRRVQARVCAEDLKTVNSGFKTYNQDDCSVSEFATAENIPDTN